DTLGPASLSQPDIVPLLLPANNQRVRTALDGQDLWLQVQVSNAPGQAAVSGYLLMDHAPTDRMAFWLESQRMDHLLVHTVRGPALPITLSSQEIQPWTLHLQGMDHVDITLSFETTATFQYRTAWLTGYVFALAGAGLLAAGTLGGSHLRRLRRRRLSKASRSWLLWPGYLLSLTLFTLIHYLGLPGFFQPNSWTGLVWSSLLLTMMIMIVSTIWWASSRPLRGGRHSFPAYMLFALVMVGTGWAASLGWRTLDIFYGSLLFLAAARLSGWGLLGREVHALAPVTAALSLMIWAVIGLLQNTPLSFSSGVQATLLPSLLAVHGWAIYQSFLPGRLAADRPGQQTQFLDQADSSFVLLRKLNHDLRSPIHGVLGMTSLLSETHLNADQQEYVTTTHNAGIQMLNLADEMRALTRLASGRIEVRSRSVELNEFFHEVVSPFARLASQKAVEVVTDVLSTAPHRVKIDPELVSQVLRIILDNSVKFTDQGVIQVTVRLEGINRLRIRIDDTGRGVGAADLPRLFEFQNNQKDLESGQSSMRLGLPVANALVQAMKGQIGVTRAAQQGASFWLSVPFEVDDTTTEKSNEVTVANLLEQKILVVDDHLASRKVLEDQTRNWGMMPELASSAKEALALLQSHMYFHQPFDWVLIDYRMPEMNGLELVEKIRALDGLKHLRVIVMSGVDLHYVEQTADDLGVVAVLAKPVNSRQLMRLMSEHTR
ncbi:MAG: ATP-binding protein, partial [Natronospirillum sp.]